MKRLCVSSLLTLFIWQETCLANPLLFAREAWEIAINIYETVEMAHGLMGEEKFMVSKDTAKVMEELNSLSTSFQEMKHSIKIQIAQMQDVLIAKTDELFKHVRKVESVYKTFLEIFKNRDAYEPSSIKEFAEEVTSPTHSRAANSIRKMYESLFDKNFKEDNIFSMIVKHASGNLMCIKGKSHQLIVHDLYKLAVNTHTKGFIAILYGWHLRGHFQNTTFTMEKNYLKNQYKKYVSYAFDYTLSVMKKSSTEVWKCDPISHEKNVTYFKFDGILQTYILYQPDVKTHSNVDAFVLPCEDYKDERLDCHSFPCESQPEDKRCYGHIRDCKFFENQMEICHAPSGSDKRYEWLKTESGLLFGHQDGEKSDCPRYTQGVGSSLTVDTCVCTCESEDQISNRYISTLIESSTIEENKVVTGVRFVHKNHVLYLQIQQGVLGEKGVIEGEAEWKPVREISESDLLSKKVSAHFKTELSDWTEFYRNDLVFSLTYKNRFVLLDDLRVRPGSVVTGVRLLNLDESLFLMIRQTAFDYETGKLRPAENKWLFNGNKKDQRDKVPLVKPDEPIRAPESDLYSSNNKYVEMRKSSMKSDFGQHVVPYFDVQEVSLNPPLPLEGVGIFHKGKSHFGGFIAAKIMHYDFTKHIEKMDEDGDDAEDIFS